MLAFSFGSRFSGFPEPYDFEQVIVSSTAVGLDATKTKNCRAVMIHVEGNDIRFRVDWQDDPTSSVGIPMHDGDQIFLARVEARQFKAIRQVGDATIWATYYR